VVSVSPGSIPRVCLWMLENAAQWIRTLLSHSSREQRRRFGDSRSHNQNKYRRSADAPKDSRLPGRRQSTGSRMIDCGIGAELDASSRLLRVVEVVYLVIANTFIFVIAWKFVEPMKTSFCPVRCRWNKPC
jgi:hypothetical protein